ncbi:hypothetical protein ACFQOZ_18185 [Comamonas endophytica]|uniref:hypothetical protein n=1 Tax=Comamonas endophytica TaxID=2949090 RepID=UPI003610EF58
MLDHLESFKKAARNSEESAAASRFIDLIHAAYRNSKPVDTKGFITGLQNLAPFNKRDAAGELEFKLDTESYLRHKDPAKFLSLLAEAFRFDTFPGWSFDVDETYVHHGQERPHQVARNSFQMFQPVRLSEVKPADYASFSLQKLVDLLYAEAQAQVKWNEGDANPTTVKLRRQPSIADAQVFKRLTIQVQGPAGRPLTIFLADSVTLAVIDRKTQQRVVLTMAPREALMWSHSRYVVRIRNEHGKWMTHDDSFVSEMGPGDMGDQVELLNFAVTHIAPAP